MSAGAASGIYRVSITSRKLSVSEKWAQQKKMEKARSYWQLSGKSGEQMSGRMGKFPCGKSTVRLRGKASLRCFWESVVGQRAGKGGGEANQSRQPVLLALNRNI